MNKDETSQTVEIIDPPDCPHLAVLYEALGRLLIIYAEKIFGASTSISLGKPQHAFDERSGNKCYMHYDVPVKGAGPNDTTTLRVTLAVNYKGRTF